MCWRCLLRSKIPMSSPKGIPSSQENNPNRTHPESCHLASRMLSLSTCSPLCKSCVPRIRTQGEHTVAFMAFVMDIDKVQFRSVTISDTDTQEAIDLR
jgi:hypothetical protein